MFKQSEINDLNIIFDHYSKQLCKMLPDDSEVEDITFSDKFERKMSRLLFHQRQFYYPLINTVAKRVACFIITILTIMSVTTFSVKAFRDPVIEFLINTFKEGTTIIFNPDKEVADTKFEPKRPAYIPSAFNQTLTNVTKTDSAIIWLRDADDRDFYFEQTHKTENPRKITINTENGITSIVTIKGKYKAFLNNNKGILWLGFETDTDIFEISMPSEYTEAELIKIAESIDC